MLTRYLPLLLASIVIVSCGQKPQSANDIHYVKVFTVGNSVYQSSSTFHGIVHAEFEPSLSFRIGGKIIQRNVDIGQMVKVGQVLASLDPTDYRLSADSSVANLASAKSNYITQQANLQRYQQLLKQNFVSQAQFDTQQAQFDSAKAQYNQAQNQVSNSENQVKYTVLKAPAEGIITSINMDAGQVVNAGQTVATMAVSGNKEVEIELPEAQINDYKVGMVARIKIWATGSNYQGKVRIVNQANDQQTRTFTARIVINNADDNIKYGMAADVTLQPLNSQNGLELPLSSLYAKNGKSYIWVIDKNSTAKLIPIIVLSTDGEAMKIEAPELKSGDNVVSAGANFIYAGQKLAIYKN
jgi:RND family efflux transporter MFP subunit